MGFVTKLEFMNSVKEEVGEHGFIFQEKDSSDYVPIRFRGIFRPAGKCIGAFDDIGSPIAKLRGFVPINGGTVLYFDDLA